MFGFFSLLLSVSFFFNAINASAAENNEFNPKNYVYNNEGEPLFVKVYIESSNRNINADSLSLQKEGLHILNLMMQEDRKGSFLVIPIKKKKSKSDDDDESTWICPYCDTENEASRNTCQNPQCVLHRKAGRDWNNFLELR